MAKINYMDRENHLHEYEIKEDLITMGREATNKVVVADPSVSRQHAWIEKREDGYYLVDKNSSNGTYVNGRKVSQQKLKHNDKVNLGSASLIFEDEEEGLATYILPRTEMAPSDMMTTLAPQERQTDALSHEDIPPAEEAPLPPPPPLVNVAPAPPPPPPPRAVSPAPVPPPPVSAPEPPAEAAPGVLCPSCRKIVERGARFCPFCGTGLAPSSKPAPQPVPPPPPSPPLVVKPAVPPPPPPAMTPPRASTPPPPPVMPRSAPPVPSFGAPAPKFATIIAPSNLNYAGFGPRLIAYLIDTVILMLLMLLPLIVAFLVAAPLRAGDRPSPVAFLVLGVCSLVMMVIGIGYQLYFIGAKGATPGKKMMKLRVATPEGQFPIGYGKAFLRMIGYAISGMVCYLGFLWILIDKEQHRGWHDKIAGTVVIRE